jgi:polysaccharide pyruvyl transferase WcaK-like protein
MKWSYFKNKIETEFSNYRSYLHEMAVVADRLVSEHGVKVVLYPTNYPVHGCREDDLSTAVEIRKRMKHGGEVTIIEELPPPARLKGMLACSELNITTRMHACILSTGAGVPTISVNYLFKVREYMRSLGLEEFSIDIEEFNSDWALDAFGRMWPERERWRDHISGKIGEKKKNIKKAMENLDDLVR